MKVNFLLALLLLIFVACNKNEEPVTNFDKGVMYFDKGDYFNSEKYFLKSEETNIDNSLIYLLKIYEKKKDEVKIKSVLNTIKEKPTLIFPLAYEYLNGSDNLEKNEERARNLFEVGAKHEDKMSYLALGNIYEHGLGVKINLIKSKSYYEKSGFNLELKNTLGINYLTFIEGLRYEKGIDKPKDIDKAKELYKKAMDQNSRDAYTRLGYIQIEEKKTERHVKNGINYLEKAWGMGDKNALINLGKIYMFGITVPRDLVKAKEYFVKGMDSEIGEAFGYYTHIEVYNSESLVIDYKAIKEIAETGVKYKDGNSYKILGYLYQNGFGVKKNERVAEKYYLKAIELGNLIDNLVYWYLGNLYFYGGKRVQNNEKALKNYLIASDYYEASAYEVGLIYENGYGVDIDIEKAKEYYKKASGMVPKADERYKELSKEKINDEEIPPKK